MSRAYNLTGRTFGRCVIGERVYAMRNGAYWKVKCSCGREFEARTSTILAASAGYCCQTCRPRNGFLSASVLNCSICRCSGHNRLSCPERPTVKASLCCARCENLSWRRDFPHCSKCGEAFAEEAPMTIAEILERPRGESRTMPEGGL